MKTIKMFILTVFMLWVISLGNQVKAQAQATSVNQTNRDGTQCSSAGVGYGKDKQEAQINADKNREKAENKARRKGDNSFSNKTGGGTAICINYNQQSTANFTLINKNVLAKSMNMNKEKAETLNKGENMTTIDNNIEELNNEVKPLSDYHEEYRGKQAEIIKKVEAAGETVKPESAMFKSELNKLKEMFKKVRMADYGLTNETDMNTMRLVDTDVATLFQFLQVVRNQ